MKKILNEANNKLNKIDYIFLTIIIVIYSILSFINLGDLRAPQTHYNIIKNEMVTVELKNPDDIIKMKFYNTEQTSTYQIDISEDNINYTSSGMVEGNGAFAWTEFKILGKAKYIRITSLDNSSLGELAFYNNGGNIVTINKIYSNYKDIKELTDEQDTIPRNINYMNSSYFDEVYFARTAYEYINNLNIYEWTHPPLGKLIQAIPIKISNTMAPFYYRFMGNIAGILMIPIMYLLGKELFKKRKYAIASSLLILLDNFHFAQTRMGTVDSYLVLFIMLSFYFMFRFINNKNTNINLLLSGLFIGLAISVKWTGLYAGLGLAIIYLIDIIKNKKISIKLLLKTILFFIIVPATIYISSFYLFPKLLNTEYQFSNLIGQQQSMYKYHSGIKETHTFSSKWYQWPIFYRPVWYYTNQPDTLHTATITGLGNIAIWWFSIIPMLYLIYKMIRKRDITSINLLIIYLSMLLPYMFIGRIMFQYHYFIVMPFVLLAIINFFKDIEEKYKISYLIPTYLLIVLIVFLIYFPVVSGIPITNEHSESLKLLASWYW